MEGFGVEETPETALRLWGMTTDQPEMITKIPRHGQQNGCQLHSIQRGPIMLLQRLLN